jgi:hypothetical protein
MADSSERICSDHLTQAVDYATTFHRQSMLEMLHVAVSGSGSESSERVHGVVDGVGSGPYWNDAMTIEVK